MSSSKPPQPPQSEWAALKNQSRSCRRAVEALERRLDQLLAEVDPDVIGGLPVVDTEVAEWKALGTTAIQRAEQLMAQWRPKRDSDLETLPQRLARELEMAGFDVFGTGGLLVVNGIVYLEIEGVAARVSINEVRFTDMRLQSLVTAVASELARLQEAAVAPSRMLDQLLHAYDRAIDESGSRPGSQVRTSDLFPRLVLDRQSNAFRADPIARHFREYRRAQFRADLYGLLKSGETSINQRRFSYASGADTAGAVFILVPALGRTAHVGRVWFE
jgi:hypothetical protein